MTSAANLQVLLLDQWVADQARDGRPMVGAVRPWTRGAAARAGRSLQNLGMALPSLDALAAAQIAIESDEGSAAEAAEPTAQSLAGIFRQVAGLPGAPPVLQSTSGQAALDALGASLGRFVYLVDALRDLRRDLLRGDFNPCLARQGEALAIDSARVAACCAALDDAATDLQHAAGSLPWQRHRSLLGHLLEERAPRIAREVSAQARAWADDADRLEALRERSALRRALDALLVAWSWLLAPARRWLSAPDELEPMDPPADARKKRRSNGCDSWDCCCCEVLWCWTPGDGEACDCDVGCCGCDTCPCDCDCGC